MPVSRRYNGSVYFGSGACGRPSCPVVFCTVPAGLGTPSIRMLRLGRYTHPCPASFPTALQNFLDCNPLSISTLYRYLFPEHFLSRFRPSSRPSPLAFVFAFLFVIP